MKEFLKKLIEKRNARITQIRSAIAASTDVNEVRTLTAEAEQLQDEVRDAEAKLQEIESEERAAAQAAEQRDSIPKDAKLVNGEVKGVFGQKAAEESRSEEDPTGSMEYRKAFMGYVQKGTTIPADLLKRAGNVISTAETGAAVPITIMIEPSSFFASFWLEKPRCKTQKRGFAISRWPHNSKNFTFFEFH